MQELRSTEILDKEIRSDARHKAEAVLKRADEECAQILAGVDRRIEVAKQEKQEFYEKKLAAVEKDLNASGPLEKQRLEVSFVQDELVKAINKYLKDLPQEKRLELVLNSCTLDKAVAGSNEFNVFVYGFDKETACKMLEAKLGIKTASCSKTEFGRIVTEDDLGLENQEGIIIESMDKSVRCRLTLSEIFGRIMDKYRAQLADALFSDAGESGGAE